MLALVALLLPGLALARGTPRCSSVLGVLCAAPLAIHTLPQQQDRECCLYLLPLLCPESLFSLLLSFRLFLGGAACLCVSLLKMTWDRFVRRAAKRSNKETLPYRTRLDPSGETRETGCVHHAMVNYVVVVVAARAHRGVVTKAAAAATIRGESN